MENTQPLALTDKKCNISLYISKVALEKGTKVFIDKKLSFKHLRVIGKNQSFYTKLLKEQDKNRLKL